MRCSRWVVITTESTDLELTADEVASIDALDQDVRLAADPDDIEVD